MWYWAHSFLLSGSVKAPFNGKLPFQDIRTGVASWTVLGSTNSAREQSNHHDSLKLQAVLKTTIFGAALCKQVSNHNYLFFLISALVVSEPPVGCKSNLLPWLLAGLCFVPSFFHTIPYVGSEHLPNPLNNLWSSENKPPHLNNMTVCMHWKVNTLQFSLPATRERPQGCI